MKVLRDLVVECNPRYCFPKHKITESRTREHDTRCVGCVVCHCCFTLVTLHVSSCTVCSCAVCSYTVNKKSHHFIYFHCVLIFFTVYKLNWCILIQMRQRLLRVDTRVSATACVCMQYRRSLAVCKNNNNNNKVVLAVFWIPMPSPASTSRLQRSEVLISRLAATR